MKPPQLAASQLRTHLPGTGLRTAGQRPGDPGQHRTHTPRAGPDGSFPVVAPVWRPGQATQLGGGQAG